MAQRADDAAWVAAGILEAVKGFRRMKGYADMLMLVAALRARDRQLGLSVAQEEQQIASTQPPVHFNSPRDIPDVPARQH